MTALLVRKRWEGHKQRMGGRDAYAREGMPWINGYPKKPGSGEGFDPKSQQQHGPDFEFLSFRTARE